MNLEVFRKEPKIADYFPKGKKIIMEILDSVPDKFSLLLLIYFSLFVASSLVINKISS